MESVENKEQKIETVIFTNDLEKNLLKSLEKLIINKKVKVFSTRGDTEQINKSSILTINNDDLNLTENKILTQVVDEPILHAEDNINTITLVIKELLYILSMPVYKNIYIVVRKVCMIHFINPPNINGDNTNNKNNLFIMIEDDEKNIKIKFSKKNMAVSGIIFGTTFTIAVYFIKFVGSLICSHK